MVEVLGRTIKVLSVRDGEPNWTILKPTTVEESKHGMEIILGHIAELHYTSLRLASMCYCIVFKIKDSDSLEFTLL